MNNKIILLSLCVFAAVTLSAQNKSGLETKVLRLKASKEKIADAVAEDPFVKKFNPEKERGITYISVVAKVSKRFCSEELAVHGITVGSRIGDIVTMRVPIQSLDVLESCVDVLQYDVARPVQPMLNNTRFDTRADSVQQGLGLSSAYTGKDVLIGITDWGFDYTHPNFYDSTKTEYRVYKVWDQFKQSGPPPAGFSYGTELSSQTALLDAQCDTPGVYYYTTHGTHVAGICGGSGAGTNYKGMAPDAKFMFVSFKLNEAGALDAFAWLKDQAREANKRLVVNMSWGMYSFGANDGTSLMSQAINSYADSGVVFVSSAGNNGNVNFHLKKVFDSLPDTLRSIVSFSGNVGEGISAWGSIGGAFKLGLSFRMGDSVFANTPFYATDSLLTYVDTALIIGSDTVYYNVAMEQANINNGRPYAFINISTSPYTVHLFAVAQQGDTIHLWNVYNKEDHAGNTGVPFYSNNYPGYSNGDHFYGLSEPTVAEKCISVAAHSADRLSTRDSSYIAGNIASFSSFGPTLTNNKKPEISAPGLAVNSSISYFSAESYTPSARVYFNRRYYRFASLNGTSMASPTVTGVVALILQANPALTVDEIRDIIIQTARTDEMTGDLRDSCSIRWGYGKIDALAAVKKALETVGINEAAPLQDGGLRVYPNPAKNMLFVSNESGEDFRVSLFDISGRMIVNAQSAKNGLDVSGLKPGVYVLRAEMQDRVSTARVVIAR